jgi:hypothetical protein
VRPDWQASGASAYILDLRNNPGGLVRSSIDIARLWMDGQPVVFNVSGREVGGAGGEQLPGERRCGSDCFGL